jgi:hypothetical protein
MLSYRVTVEMHLHRLGAGRGGRPSQPFRTTPYAFDPLNRETYPKVNAPVPVKYDTGIVKQPIVAHSS